MKFRFLHIAILTTVLLWAATSCIWEKGTDVYEDDVVVVSLPVENPSSESYSMDTKATDAEERALKNLYVYIFNESGALKGFAAFNSGLDQSTSDTKGKYGTVKVKTTAGALIHLCCRKCLSGRNLSSQNHYEGRYQGNNIAF